MNICRLLFNNNSISSMYRRPRNSLLCIILFSFCMAGAKSAELQTPETLIKSIRQGGYVLFMRHTTSDRTQTDTDTLNLVDCSKQRNLSAQGRIEALNIGEAIRVLNIPIGTVLTSPYCRCVDTALLTFGHGKKSNNLRFTMSMNEQETQRLADALKILLATKPAAGTNTVLVAHTGNLKEAANVWPKPEGVLHVFRPLEEKGFEHLGHISPDQWQTLIQAM